MIKEDSFRLLSMSAIDQLVYLHKLDLNTTGLDTLGKPDGYVARQVDGWTKRYSNSQTDEIASMKEVAEWMQTTSTSQFARSFYS
ncbi:MAG: hypothetical protein U5K54_14635 [Cytophagales bacterium]|nr:hypothetical protein [Cytophagales bacterium]